MTAFAMAPVLVVSLAQAFPAKPAPDAQPTGDRERVVAGHTVKSRPRPAMFPKGSQTAAKAAAKARPAPGSAEVAVPTEADAAAVRAGSLPVWVNAPAKPGKDKAGPVGQVKVRLLDQAAARKAGVDGVAFTVQRTDTAAVPDGETGRVAVQLGYSQFAQAFGGSYGNRLNLRQLPACALTTPQQAGCGTSSPVDAVNDGNAQTLSADVELAANEPVVLAAAAEPSGPSGDYKATSLSPSATWQSGSSSGDFTWSYPVRVPPVPGGLTPDVSIGYSSGSVDGRTGNSNGQPSWVGEGFDLWPGYIQRGYKSCEDDGAPKDEWGNSPGDQCWGYDNATITWNGKGGELIPAGDGQWKLKNDDGTRIEKLTGAGNGDDNGEYWKVTATDGTQYFFGRNRWQSGDPETASAWTAPVFGDDDGEPCHDASFASSWCQQAYRWNLDFVVDPRGNAVVYHYAKETNYYGRNLKPEDETAYVRGGWLKRIDYGLRSDNLYPAAAPARVEFNVSERCIRSAASECDPGNIATNPDYWWDVPWDLHCDSGQDCKDEHGAVSPTFWSRKRLTEIKTRVLGSDGATYTDVESWGLDHEWGLADIDRDLLLKSIQHTGTATGTAVSLPPVTFSYGTAMPNRVDKLYDDIPPYLRYRLDKIADEYGGQIDVNYSATDCATGDIPTPATNTRRCYPNIWQPAGHENPITDWFHKYVATQVIQTDRTGGNPDIVTDYTYSGGGAWHYDDDDGLTKEKDKTWSQWRGYGKVVETSGGWGTPRSQSDHYFFRGMDGDRATASGGEKDVTVSDGEGGTYDDHEAWQGMEVRSLDYDAPGGNVVTKTVNAPWRHQTATRTRTWGTVTANLTGTATTRTFTALEAGGWRETRKNTTFDTVTGLATQDEDLGDVSTSADNRCTTTSYAQDSGSAWLMNFPSRQRALALACDQTPTDLSKQLISDTRSYYDDGAFGAAPTKGLITKVDKAAAASATTVSSYVTQSQTSYDSYGRPRTSTDPLNQTTTTTYTDTAGLNTGMSVASPPVTPGTPSTALTTSQVINPAYGNPTSQTDAGGKITTLAYDGLGRLAEVRLPNTSGNLGSPPNYAFTYQVTDGQPVAIGTTQLAGPATKTSYELLDGLLRSRQTQAPAPEGKRLISDTFYNDQGLAEATYEPYNADGAPATGLFGVITQGNIETQHALTYDGLGRQTLERVLSGNGEGITELWRTTTRYGGDRVHVTPPNGGTPTTTITDARDQTTELRQYKGDTPTGDYDATRYNYTPAGQLKTITDAGGNTWTYTYDLRGRKTNSSDPDTGASITTYDDLDRVSLSEDARGKKIAYTYDPAGRKTGIFEGSTSGTKLADWVYDTARKGQLSSTTRYVGGAAYKTAYSLFDNLNRPLRTTRTIPSVTGETALAGSFLSGNAFNIDSTVQSTGYGAAGDLAAETVVTDYDADNLKRPVGLVGASSYVVGTNYSATGKPEQYQLRLNATSGPKTLLTMGYEYGTQRMNLMRVEREGVLGVDRSAVYSYDDAGNVTSINDTSRVGGDNQCFQYDHLRRLTEAWTQSAGTCSSTPGANLGGPAPYWQSFGYNTAGNRTSETSHTTNGSVAATRTYSYGQGHRLDSVTQTGTDPQTGTGPHSETYGYDAAGNTTGRDNGLADQTLAWNSEGRLASVTDDDTGTATSFIYDADGNRLLRREPGATTLYLGDQELRLDKASGKVTATRYYTFNGQKIAMRDATGVRFLAADHHGTAEQSINATDLTIAQRRFTPFGGTRGTATGTWLGDKTFVGGTSDTSTGLTHLGAREYDPTLGRFTSADPILDPSDPTHLNAYGYGANNPLAYSDPDGLKPECGYGCDYNPGTKKTHYYSWSPCTYCKKASAGTYGGGSGGNTPTPRAGTAPAAVAAPPSPPPPVLRVVPIPQPGPPPIPCSEQADGCDGKLPVHEMLDLIGLIPVAGDAFDVINAGLYLAEGDKTNAALSGSAIFIPAATLPRLIRRAKAIEKAESGLEKTAARLCSFSGATLVLMADGTKKPIDQIQVGDKVHATDPETGEQAAKTVERVWVHTDTLTDLQLADGTILSTTEDHPYWSVDDQKFERADQLAPGERVLNADGHSVEVSGFRLATARYGLAYNLSVKGIHTYHVGQSEVVVHNECSDEAWDIAMHAFDDHGAALGFESVEQMGAHIDEVMSASKGTLRDDGTRFWVDYSNSAIIFRGPNRGVPGSFYRPDNFPRAVQQNMDRSVTE